MSTRSIRWAARVGPVREIALSGLSDLEWWRHRLAPEGLEPRNVAGNASLLVVGVSARFGGVPFRELSVIVELAGADPGVHHVYLAGAFNSVRFFAFCERTFFHTPYAHAHVDVGLDPVRIAARGTREFIEAAKGTALPAQPGDHEIWNGIVSLPPARGRTRGGKAFLVSLEGSTVRIPFEDRDILRFDGSGPRVVQQLAASGFRPGEWMIRRDATHAKSRTYSREVARKLARLL